MRISSNPSQYDNLAVFIREQEIIRDLVEKFSIPKLLVDVTDRSLEQQVSHIADWLEATGGLNPAESPPNPKTVLCAPTTWRQNPFTDSQVLRPDNCRVAEL
ncbi:MAG: hypothetical protein WB696_28020 [Chthoniobacterales bacterium]